MKRPRFRFTIGQLIAAVAACAVLFWLLRTPAWPLVIAIVPVLPGFAVDRARGGSGILGAMLAGVIMTTGCGFAFLAYRHRAYGPFLAGDPPSILWVTLFLASMGLIWGALVGFEVHMILRLVRAIRRYGMPGEPGGPIARVVDRGLPQSRSGGRPT